MEKGFIALLDVLGFRNLISGDSSEEKVRAYLDCVKSIATDVDYVVFSDSIVLTPRDNKNDPLVAVAGACSRLLHDLLKKDIPVRGAIAYGGIRKEVIGNSVFVAGPAVVDAYWYEKEQDWVGIMLAPSAVQATPDLRQMCSLEAGRDTAAIWLQVERRFPYSAFVQPYAKIPFHKENSREERVFSGFAIVPTDGEWRADSIIASITRARDRLESLRLVAQDPEAQMKYQRAEEWLLALVSQWTQILFAQQQAPKS